MLQKLQFQKSMPLRIEDSKELNYWKYKGVQKGLKWTKEVHKGPKKFTEVQLGPEILTEMIE
jgi:hypothetical protein